MANVEANLNSASLKRLAEMSGCARVAGDAYQEIRAQFVGQLTDVLNETIGVMQHGRRKILKAEDLTEVLRARGIKHYLVTGKIEVVKSKEALLKAKKSGGGGSVFIAPTKFKRVVMDYGMGKEIKYSADFLANFQVYMEQYMITKLAAACQAAFQLGGGRQTVTAKDIKYVFSFGCNTVQSSTMVQIVKAKAKGKAKGKAKSKAKSKAKAKK
jgi:histone H3/H4